MHQSQRKRKPEPAPMAARKDASSDAGGPPAHLAPVSGAGLRLSQREIAFGRCLVGQRTDQRRFSVINNTQRPVTITAITDARGRVPEELSVYGFSSNHRINPGGWLALELDFTASHLGPYSTQLHFHTEDGQVIEPLAVSGTGDTAPGAPLPGPLTPRPSSRLRFPEAIADGRGPRIDLPTTEIGATSTLRTVVENPGTEEVAIASLATGVSALEVRTLLDGAALAPGERRELELAFTPTRAGAFAGTLQISTQGGPTASIAVRGIATAKKSAARPPAPQETPSSRWDRQRRQPGGNEAAAPVVAMAIDELRIQAARRRADRAGTEGSAAFVLDVSGGPGQLHFQTSRGFFVSKPRGGVSVQPGDRVQIEVTFRPTAGKTTRGSVSIRPSFGPPLSIPVIGEVEGPLEAKVPVREEASEKLGHLDGDSAASDMEPETTCGDPDLHRWISNVKAKVGTQFKDQRDAVGEMQVTLERRDAPVASGLLAAFAERAAVFAAGAIGEMVSQGLKSVGPATMAAKVVIAGIKDVVKAEVKKQAGISKSTGMSAADRFVKQMLEGLNASAEKVEIHYNNLGFALEGEPDGAAVAKEIFDSYKAIGTAAKGIQKQEVLRQWARCLAAPSRAPGGEVAEATPDGFIEIHLEDALVGREPLVQSARWSGLSTEAANQVTESNRGAITLLELGIPYRLIINDGECVIERWPDESRPRFRAPGQYWLARYWGWKVGKPGIGPGNSPNPVYVIKGLESIVAHIDAQTMTGLNLAGVPVGGGGGSD
jgi:hypothetical protein